MVLDLSSISSTSTAPRAAVGELSSISTQPESIYRLGSPARKQLDITHDIYLIAALMPTDLYLSGFRAARMAARTSMSWISPTSRDHRYCIVFVVSVGSVAHMRSTAVEILSNSSSTSIWLL